MLGGGWVALRKNFNGLASAGPNMLKIPGTGYSLALGPLSPLLRVTSLILFTSFRQLSWTAPHNEPEKSSHQQNLQLFVTENPEEKSHVCKDGRNQNFSAERKSSFMIAVNFVTANHNLGFALKYFNSLLFCRNLSSV